MAMFSPYVIMDALAQQAIRAQRGLKIATEKRITKRGPVWVVPSQSHGGSYVVENDGVRSTCTCPDHELRQQPCKHVIAVEIVRTKSMPDGTIVQETIRATYSQDWSAYNAAQGEEKRRVMILLKDLCKGIVEPPQALGRPRLPLKEAVLASAAKVFCGMSGRRSESDMDDLVAKGLLAPRRGRKNGHVAPHFNTILRTIENPALTPLYKALVEASAAPLAAIETDFATDSSGFSSGMYRRWFDHKYGKETKEHQWVKCHLTCGVRTNVITAVVAREEWSADSPEMPGLLKTTAKRFKIAQASADKAYSSHENIAAITALGAVPFIPFKDGTGDGVNSPAKWKQAFHFFSFHREAFLRNYHKRSNVETTFSMMKRKFGPDVAAKSFSGQVNEVYIKAMLHNACCLVSAFHELGVESQFSEVFSTETLGL